MNRQLINGDCLEELKKLDDNSVDLLCTDPPYGYGFMGKHWLDFGIHLGVQNVQKSDKNRCPFLDHFL